MDASRFPRTRDGRVVAGAVCWVLTLVFFVGQVVAQVASTEPYSLTRDYVSELGVTACGPLSSGGYRAVICSPLHDVMNGAFVATGVFLALGAIGTWAAWPRRRLVTWGLALLVLAGAGKVLVGLAPANLHPDLHGLGALLGIGGADLGMLLLGLALWNIRPWLGVSGAVLGVAGLVAFLFLLVVPLLGPGPGLTERVADEPVYVWLIAAGAAILLAPRAPV
jgi:hypothetical membrane protein